MITSLQKRVADVAVYHCYEHSMHLFSCSIFVLENIWQQVVRTVNVKAVVTVQLETVLHNVTESSKSDICEHTGHCYLTNSIFSFPLNSVSTLTLSFLWLFLVPFSPSLYFSLLFLASVSPQCSYKGILLEGLAVRQWGTTGSSSATTWSSHRWFSGSLARGGADRTHFHCYTVSTNTHLHIAV